MVMNAAEAHSLIETRDRTGKHLVVAFQGGLSPQIRHAARLIASGALGELRAVTGMIWQGWKDNTAGKWRQIPEIAGGGFLFDSGAHMLNTVCTLAGEDFESVAAWLDNRGTAVDIDGVVMGRLASGALATLNGCGDCIPGLHNEIYVNLTKGRDSHGRLWRAPVHPPAWRNGVQRSRGPAQNARGLGAVYPGARR